MTDPAFIALRAEWMARAQAAFADADKLNCERWRHLESLITAMDRRWEVGDRRLCEQIEAQASSVMAVIDAQKHAVTIAREADQKAILKAESANEKRFESANEWRQQSADRERSQQEQMAILTGTLMPREVAAQQFNEFNARLAKLEETESRLSGARDQRERHSDRTQPVALWAAGVVMTIFVTAVIIVANVLSGG